LVYARKGSGKDVSFGDYCKARDNSPDIDPQTFGKLVAECGEGDPGFTWREHWFRPMLRDFSGRTYEILERFQDRITLLRDDGVQGYTTALEFRSFFVPIDGVSLTDRMSSPQSNNFT
jgi:hypothetical protein